MMKKVIVLQLKNDYYDGNLWALKWSKSMIALAVNDYTTIKKKKCNLKSPSFSHSLLLSTSCVIYSNVSSKDIVIIMFSLHTTTNWQRKNICNNWNISFITLLPKCNLHHLLDNSRYNLTEKWKMCIHQRWKTYCNWFCPAQLLTIHGFSLVSVVFDFSIHP